MSYCPGTMQFKLSDIRPDNADVLSFLADVSMHVGVDRVGLRLGAITEAAGGNASSLSAKKRKQPDSVNVEKAWKKPSSLSSLLTKQPKEDGSQITLHATESSHAAISSLYDHPRDVGGHITTSDGMVPGMNQPVCEMIDSTKLYKSKDYRGLYEAFERDGYVLIRGIVNRSALAEAHTSALSALCSQGMIADNGEATVKEGMTVDAATGCFIPGNKAYITSGALNKSPHAGMWNDLLNESCVAEIKAGRAVKSAFRALADGRQIVEGIPITARAFSPKYEWLRVKAPGEFTPEHTDIFYFLEYTGMFETYEAPGVLTAERNDDLFCVHCFAADRDTEFILCEECNACAHIGCLAPPLDKIPDDNWYCHDCEQRAILVSCWTPLADVPVHDGVLCVLEGSQKLMCFDKPDVRRSQLPASYKSGGRGLRWVTTAFKAGDIALFNSRAVHCTSKNYSDHFRLSIDTRWVLAPQDRPNFRHTVPGKFILQNSVDVSL